MMLPLVRRAAPAFLLFALVVAGCGDKEKDELARLDQELGNAASVDPPGRPGPTKPGLGDAIVVDRKPAPGGMLRAPAPTPAGARPATLGSLAAEQAKAGRKTVAAKDCDKNFGYDLAWAKKLPADLPLHPQAKVLEAAGNDSPGCRMRIVSFSVAVPRQAAIDWYYTKAIRAGYSSEHQISDGDNILAGAREKDGGAYYITFAAAPDGGTSVDLIANNGI